MIFIYSFYFNFRYLPFKEALYLPIKINYKVKVNIDKTSKIIINSKIKRPFKIELGFKGTGFVSQNKDQSITLIKHSILYINDFCVIAEGLNIYCDGGTLNLKGNIYINRNCTIQCCKNITINNHALLGWNINIRDTDGHAVKYENKVQIEKKPIIIGVKVWVAANVTILKGSVISDGSIVATGSIVTGLVMREKDCLIAGIPARIKKRNIVVEN